jgi:hypothetical protein
MNLDLLESDFFTCPSYEVNAMSCYRQLMNDSSTMSDVSLIRNFAMLFCLVAKEYSRRGSKVMRSRAQLPSDDIKLMWCVAIVCLAPARSDLDLTLGTRQMDTIGTSYLYYAKLLAANLLRAFRSQDRLAIIAKGEFFSHVLKHRGDYLERPHFASRQIFGLGFEAFVQRDDPTGLTLSRSLREGVLRTRNGPSIQPRSSMDSAR